MSKRKKPGPKSLGKQDIHLRLTQAETLACVRLGLTAQRGIIGLIHSIPTYDPSEESLPRRKNLGKRRASAHRIPVKLILTATQVTICCRFGKTPYAGILALIAQKDNTGKGRANGKGFKRGPYTAFKERRETMDSWLTVQEDKTAKTQYGIMNSVRTFIKNTETFTIPDLLKYLEQDGITITNKQSVHSIICTMRNAGELERLTPPKARPVTYRKANSTAIPQKELLTQTGDGRVESDVPPNRGIHPV